MSCGDPPHQIESYMFKQLKQLKESKRMSSEYLHHTGERLEFVDLSAKTIGEKFLERLEKEGIQYEIGPAHHSFCTGLETIPYIKFGLGHTGPYNPSQQDELYINGFILGLWEQGFRDEEHKIVIRELPKHRQVTQRIAKVVLPGEVLDYSHQEKHNVTGRFAIVNKETKVVAQD